MQLPPGDIVLMKLDAFQGKHKVKDQWSETEYTVVRQVAEDKSGNVKTVHCNWLFLVATLRGDITPLGGNESTSDEGAAQSALAELTSLEWESEASEDPMPHQLRSARVGRWHSMTTTYGGPMTNFAGVRSWRWNRESE